MAEIVGFLIALGALLAMVPGLMHWVTYGSQQVRGSAAAEQAAIFNEAAGQYLTDYSGTLEATATATVPVIVTAAQMQAAGLLPATFSATNVFGQTWELQVLQPTAGALQAITLTTGGTSLDDAQAAQLAQLIGAAGGFVPENNSGAYPQTGAPYTAYGTQGSWTLQLKNYSGVTKGELVTYLSLIDTTGQITNDYLYRTAVPGNTDVNTMHTPLIFAVTETAGSACTSLGAVAQDGTGALLSCQADVWTAVGNSTWKAPVTDYAALPASGNTTGDVRLTEDTDRAFAWTGAAWTALAVDQNGNLNVPGQLTVGGNESVAGTQTVGGNEAVSGSVTAGQNVSAAKVLGSGSIEASNGSAGLSSNGTLWAASGSFSVATSGVATAPDFYDGDTGWTLSQAVRQIQANSTAIGVNTANISSNTGSINTINSNLNSTSPCSGSAPYAYNALNIICEKAQSAGLNVTYAGSFGPTYSTTTTSTGYYHYTYRGGLICVIGSGYTRFGQCSQTSSGPASYTVPSSSTPQLVVVSAIMGPNSNNEGSNWGALASYGGCSGNGSDVIVTVNGTQVADIALSQQPNDNYYQYVTAENSATFVIPANETATIAAGQSCVGIYGTIWTL